MNDARPDPDDVLERIQAEAAQAARGHLKIFFGASAGVGKTYAMLSSAREIQAQGTAQGKAQGPASGTSLVIGLVETHGRSDTEAMARDLPRLPRRTWKYRDRMLEEFDLDAALAFGAGHADALVLVDELAHSNAPGSRHRKRWQDVEELLGAGVSVWTTMNVQHLDSLNDIVSGITGIRVRETVPDRVFDNADEVVVVDLPPDELLQRLRDGKVYLPHQAERAARNFFRKGNLLALRELALRRTADRVDDEMQAYRKRLPAAPVWATREALLACVGPGTHGERVIRTCARLAAQLDVTWHAVHVDTTRLRSQYSRRRLSGRGTQREQALRILKLAEEQGAITATLAANNAPDALVRYAREHNLARLVMGRRERRWPWRRSLADAVATRADDLDVLQVALPASGRAPVERTQQQASRDTRRWQWQGYAFALAVCAATTLLATPLMSVFELTNIVMLFLLAVVGVAMRHGRGPAVFAAFVGVALFDFFFVPPRFSFAVSDVQYLLTFSVMLVVALVVGQLTAGLKMQAHAASERERRVRSLYDMSRDLSAALVAQQVAEIGARFLLAEFGARSALLVIDDANELHTLPGAALEVDAGIAQWVCDRSEPAGHGTDTLPSSRALMLPLKAPMRTRGVLAIEPEDAHTLEPEQRRLLDTCASLMAISLERIHYIEVAQNSTLQMESERLRNSLLSAISHDLRTPLASLVGLAETLELTRPAPTEQQFEIAQAIRNSAMRMNTLVNNLLDMARLESGAVQLNRQWQPLEEVIGSALAASAAPLTGRHVQVRLDDDLPLLNFDAVLIERVLVNLLENAAKYTPAGTAVELTAHLAGDAVVLNIDDHGPGLPSRREEAIFQKFERGKAETSTPGVGLGLAICRAIMQAHGGAITATTREAGGARFAITFPRGEPPHDDGADDAIANEDIGP